MEEINDICRLLDGVNFDVRGGDFHLDLSEDTFEDRVLVVLVGDEREGSVHWLDYNK